MTWNIYHLETRAVIVRREEEGKGPPKKNGRPW
jgi:hypothetical protein